jgi:hypothetical protein
LQHQRVSQREVGRAHRIHEGAGREAQPFTLLLVQTLQRVDAAEQPVRDQQVALPDHVEQRIVAPLRSAEALVLIGLRLERAIGRLAAQRLAPKIEPLGPQIHLRLRDLRGIGEDRGARPVYRRHREGGGLRRRDALGLRLRHLARHELHHQLLGAAHHRCPVLQILQRRQLRGSRGRCHGVGVGHDVLLRAH